MDSPANDRQYYLWPAALRDDTMRIMAPLNCHFYKPVKTIPVTSQEQYDELKKDDFVGLFQTFEAVEPRFAFKDVFYNAQTRFVELLASPTLYHFSKSSKSLYYTCLDTRGLEFKTINGLRLDPQTPPEMALDGFTGTRELGFYLNRPDFHHFQICQTHFKIRLSNLVTTPAATFNRIQHYKVLSLRIDVEHDLTRFCSQVLHPNVRHVFVHITSFYEPKIQPGLNTFSLERFAELLGYCKHVQTLEIVFDRIDETIDEETFHLDVLLRGDEPMSEVKAVVEKWALTTTRLETFFMRYKNHLFQLNELVFKRLLKIDRKWHFSDNINTEDDNFPACPHWQYRAKYDNLAEYLKNSHYDDVLAARGVQSLAAVEEARLKKIQEKTTLSQTAQYFIDRLLQSLEEYGVGNLGEDNLMDDAMQGGNAEFEERKD